MSQIKFHPKTRNELKEIIYQKMLKDGSCPDVSDIDVSGVQDFSFLFTGATGPDVFTSHKEYQYLHNKYQYDFDLFHSFNGDLSSWDVSNAKNMNYMFRGCEHFEGKGLENWNISKLDSAIGMFSNCRSFNGKSIQNWDFSNIKRPDEMFHYCDFKDLDVSSWNFKKAKTLSGMFWMSSFTGKGLDKWDISKVEDLSCMFRDSGVNGKTIENWNVSNVKDMTCLFKGCDLDCDLSSWDVSNVKDMRGIFACSYPEIKGLDNWKVNKKTKIGYAFSDNFKYGPDRSTPYPNWANRQYTCFPRYSL